MLSFSDVGPFTSFIALVVTMEMTQNWWILVRLTFVSYASWSMLSVSVGDHAKSVTTWLVQQMYSLPIRRRCRCPECLMSRPGSANNIPSSSIWQLSGHRSLSPRVVAIIISTNHDGMAAMATFCVCHTAVSLSVWPVSFELSRMCTSAALLDGSVRLVAAGSPASRSWRPAWCSCAV